MASNHTEQFGLNQWELSDSVIMADFNEDNRKIDAALAAGMKVKNGSYVGTGLSGMEHPNVLEFDFKPVFLAVITEDEEPEHAGTSRGIAPWLFVRPWKYTNKFFNGNTASNTFYTHVNWLDKGLSWYAQYQSGNAATPGSQLNESGVTYHYVAIG